jgi:hypothetical protein
MKPACLVIALLACSPLKGAAQTPPAPPVAPVAPLPPVPATPVLPMPVFDSIDTLDRLDLDMDLGVDLETLQSVGIVSDRVAVDLQEVREQARELARQAREDARQQIERRPFTFQLRSPNNTVIVAGREGMSQYNVGLNALQRRQYDQAITRFDQVITQKAPRADGALYWKAYSLYKLGRTDEALAALAELRRAYAKSRYLTDAQVLEADARQSSGKALTGDADNDEIKLLAIQGLQSSDPQRAVPLLENVLKATNSLQVKKRALFVLASNEQPAAHQLLVSYAKGAGTPDLQVEAIRYLMARGKQTSDAELQDIYNSTEDVSVKNAVITVLASQDDAEGLIALARKETRNDLKLRIVRQLSGMASKNKAAMDYLAELIK